MNEHSKYENYAISMNELNEEQRNVDVVHTSIFVEFRVSITHICYAIYIYISYYIYLCACVHAFGKKASFFAPSFEIDTVSKSRALHFLVHRCFLLLLLLLLLLPFLFCFPIFLLSSTDFRGSIRCAQPVQ